MQKIKEIVAQQQMKQLLQNFEDLDCNTEKRNLDVMDTKSMIYKMNFTIVIKNFTNRKGSIQVS